ncbi:MAG: DUF853 family protein [Caulobacteraceae bacterium]|nr:DUF853 family protein [Caulobacter sp.]
MDVPSGEILVGLGEDGAPVTLRLDRANRHGLIAGATGTGKTVTLQVLAEAFSRAGVPVFAADVKGDLSGLSQPAQPTDKLRARAQALGVALNPSGNPAIFWDLFGAEGHPVRATVSDLGPVLLGRLLQLSDVQAGVLNVVFHVADQEGLLLLDLDDLQAALQHVDENARAYGAQYGNVAPASVAAIQRGLLQMRSAGAEHLFGEPALKLSDLMRCDTTGRGFVSVLAADKLISDSSLYAVFLLWLMSELFEALPEVGDPDKPKLVFFFDEAHLLFTDAPKPLLDKVEQVVRLIRSKGVGVYFVTQNPQDVPDTVLAQLGLRVEHALRAYTPSEQAALKAAASSFRANPAFDTAEAIQALGVGEALVSALDENGAPTVVRKTRIRPPDSRIGPVTADERAATMRNSPVAGVYDQAVNRESAFEVLKARTEAKAAAAEAPPAQAPARTPGRPSLADAMLTSAMRAASSSLGRQVANQVGRALIRGVLGSLSRGR